MVNESLSQAQTPSCATTRTVCVEAYVVLIIGQPMPTMSRLLPLSLKEEIGSLGLDAAS